MKVYTEEDLKSFERDDRGIIICPKGDYSKIKNFKGWCEFHEECIFGKETLFGERCSFGSCCFFNEKCSFIGCCSFAEGCVFHKKCSFEKYCRFGTCCKFGEHCSFGERCTFGEECSFDKGCSFENGHKAKDGYPFMAFTGAGSREGSKVYFFNCEDDIIVRCGHWCGSLKDFKKRVKEENADPLYLTFADIVEKKYKKEANNVFYTRTYSDDIVNYILTC